MNDIQDHLPSSLSTSIHDCDSQHFTDIDEPPASPSSATTIQNMNHSPSGNEDSSTLRARTNSRHIRRRSSHLRRWIEDQHVQLSAAPSLVFDLTDTDDIVPVGTRCNPYLAYPHLKFSPVDDADSLHSYDVVDDEDIPEEPHHYEQSPSATPQRPRSPISRTQTPSSLHNLRRTFRTAASTSSTTSPSPSRFSIFQRPARSTSNQGTLRHTHSSSLSTLDLTGSLNRTTTTSGGTRWRPSVMNHFSTTIPTLHSTSDIYSRPSMSSTTTYYSNTTPSTIFDTEIDARPHVAIKPSFLSPLMARTKAGNSNSGLSSTPPSSQASASASFSQLHTSPVRGLVHKASTIRLPFSSKPVQKKRSDNSGNDEKRPAPPSDPTLPYVAYSHDAKGRVSLSSLSMSARSKKKKKLVISGIRADDTRRFEAARRWCESFGEVSQIIRMPSGDLHVHFRKTEVADQVCRLRARVCIDGVGSVYLSWYTGMKRK